MADASLFNLKGRIAMVTGAGQGVGRGIALTLARNGAGGVVVNDFHADRAEAVAEEVRALGVAAYPMAADVGTLDHIRASVARAEAALGPISILVNNAGNGGPEGFPPELPLFWQADPARWHAFFHVNLFGVMNCCHTLLPGMVERGYGRVVTIISDAARTLEARNADYAAAKAAAAGFMRGLAADAARYGVNANSIALASIGPATTPAPAEAFETPDSIDPRLARYAIRRYGTPDDIAGVALLLCSDASSWITGQTYPVNGGYSAAL